MIIVKESASALKGFIARTSLNELAQAFVLRMVLTFILHRGRMSCSQAAGSIASKTCRELKYLSDRLKTPGGIAKLKHLLAAALPQNTGPERNPA